MFQFQYFKIPRTLSRAYCARALQALEKVVRKPQQGIINLIVIDPEEMAQMNQQFRGKKGPTDILTFSYYDSQKKEKIVSVIPESWNASKAAWEISGIQVNKLSRSEAKKTKENNNDLDSVFQRNDEEVVWEIYLCLEKIKLYAEESWKTYKAQLEYIIIHGLTHLMGYDHESDEDWKEMEKVEKKIQSLLK